jgi:hypothetical protein
VIIKTRKNKNLANLGQFFSPTKNPLLMLLGYFISQNGEIWPLYQETNIA